MMNLRPYRPLYFVVCKRGRKMIQISAGEESRCKKNDQITLVMRVSVKIVRYSNLLAAHSAATRFR